jgi:CRISPR/Cas system-associated endonuclease Cas3-HD
MYVIQIKKSEVPRLINDGKFFHAIQLARIVNILRSNLRSYYNVVDSTEIELKDRINLLLIHAAFLYEGLKTIKKKYSQLLNVNSLIDHKDLIEKLKNEIKNKSSFTNSVLKNIRNKVFFHFDEDFISNMLATYNPNEDVLFAFAIDETIREANVIYPFVDDLIYRYLTSLINKGENAEQKYDLLLSQISNLSELFCTIVDDILLKKLLKGYCVNVKRNTQ